MPATNTSTDALEIADTSEVISVIIPASQPKTKQVKAAKKERSKTTKGHYVTNAELLAEFFVAKKLGKLTPTMAKYLMMVAQRYSFHPWFAGYSFREDMVCAAVVNLCANWHKFNPEKQDNPNPFSYYTTACYRSFLSYLDAERKERDIRDELLMDAGAAPSFNYSTRHGGSTGRTSDDTAFSGTGGGADD